MGCGQSKPATDEEKQAICKAVSKEMLNVFCIEDALKDPSQIKVAAPPCFDQFKETSAKLKAVAEEVAAKGDDEQSPEEAAMKEKAGEEEKPAGGMFGAIGGMFNAAKEGGLSAALDVAKDHAENLGDALMKAGSKAAATALLTMAESLDKAVESVEEPITHIGQEVCTSQKELVMNAFKDYVKKAPIPNACALCWENGPTALSQALIRDFQKETALKLKEAIGTHMKEFPVVEKADQAIDTFNKALENLAKVKEQLEEKVTIPEGFVPKPLDFDLDMYICEQTAAEIGRLMAEAEQKHREKAEDAASDQFKKVFWKEFDPEVAFTDRLLQSDYKAVQSREE